ncbi:X-ray repair cross-complementing protein 5-like isoform X1 [Gordionus sp. m RMFG-2023]|uniref:X-ray repair cross-complementing protein 5-like isoform X1 n=1 Tax=Gordionus sp. m RMFG-2023 TaxID=3053472 RepID=UPI0031FBDB11
MMNIRKVFLNYLRDDQISLVLFNSQFTSNYLEFNNVEIARAFDVPDLYFLKNIMNLKVNSEISDTHNGYFLDAILLCQDMLINSFPNIYNENEAKIKKSPCYKNKNNFIDRRIILFTNFKGNICDEASLKNLRNICETFYKSHIKMNIVGLNLNNFEFNAKLKNLSLNIFQNKPLLKIKISNNSEIKTDHKLDIFEHNLAIIQLLKKETNQFSRKFYNIQIKDQQNEAQPIIESYSFDQVFQSINSNQMTSIRAIKSMSLYNSLKINQDLLSIPIRGFYRIKNATFPRTWKKIIEESNITMSHKVYNQIKDESTNMILDDKKVINTNKRKLIILNDEDEEEFEDVDLKFMPNYVKAYKYGSTLVPFSTEDELAAQNLSSFGKDNEIYHGKSLLIIGYSKSKNIPVYKFLGDGCIEFLWDETMSYTKSKNRLGDNEDKAAFKCAFENLVTAMYESDLIAIARYQSANKRVASNQPKIVALTPKIKNNYRCLILNILPFLEDIRLYKFPNFIETHSKSADHKTLENSKDNPHNFEVIDRLIDSMNMMTKKLDLLPSDVESEMKEMLKPKYTPNPYFNILINAISHRAVQEISEEKYNSPKIFERQDYRVNFPFNPHSPQLKRVFKDLEKSFKLDIMTRPKNENEKMEEILT